MTIITDILTQDLRFPTSQSLDGSDAMNPDPDYSAAYVVLETDGKDQGHGLTFTIGRGTEICVAAIEAMRHLLVGVDINGVQEDMSRFWRHITADSQLRWIDTYLAPSALGFSIEMKPQSIIDYQYLPQFATK